jgi:hypothetical protein
LDALPGFGAVPSSDSSESYGTRWIWISCSSCSSYAKSSMAPNLLRSWANLERPWPHHITPSLSSTEPLSLRNWVLHACWRGGQTALKSQR